MELATLMALPLLANSGLALGDAVRRRNGGGVPSVPAAADTAATRSGNTPLEQLDLQRPKMKMLIKREESLELPALRPVWAVHVDIYTIFDHPHVDILHADLMPMPGCLDTGA